MDARTTRREPFDEWLHRYQPLRGRARMWHFIKRFTGVLLGLFGVIVAVLILGVGGLIVCGVLLVLGIAFIS